MSFINILLSSGTLISSSLQVPPGVGSGVVHIGPDSETVKNISSFVENSVFYFIVLPRCRLGFHFDDSARKVSLIYCIPQI